MDKPFSQHRSMLVSIRGAVLGGTRLDWAWIPVTEPTSARRIMFPFERVRNVKYADLGRIMTWQKAGIATSHGDRREGPGMKNEVKSGFEVGLAVLFNSEARTIFEF